MLHLNFHPFPVIETKRLCLKQITVTDANDLFLLRSNKTAMKYLDRPLATSIQDIEELLKKINEHWQQNIAIGWGITIKNAPRLIGTIGYYRIEKEHYRAEIGYMLHPNYWAMGIMNEAISAIIDFGFNTLKLHSIEANVNPNNVASIRILEKNKFRKEAHFKENYFFNGFFLDTTIYSLLKET